MSLVPSHIDLSRIGNGTLNKVLSLVSCVGLMSFKVGIVLNFFHFLDVEIHLVYPSN